MRLKRGYEQAIRKRLERFGRWAWVSTSKNSTPLNRLFGELADGQDVEKIRKQIEALIADPDVKKQAYRLMRKFAPANMMKDAEGQKIDRVLSYILTAHYGEQRKFLNALVHSLYMKGPNATPMLQLAREIITRTAGNNLYEPYVNTDDLESSVRCLYRCLRRVREQLETDLYFALSCIDKLGDNPTSAQLEAGLAAFSQTYYERQKAPQTLLDVKARYHLPTEYYAYFCKVM